MPAADADGTTEPLCMLPGWPASWGGRAAAIDHNAATWTRTVVQQRPRQRKGHAGSNARTGFGFPAMPKV